MSIEVELNERNYDCILNWYNLSFGQGKTKPSQFDTETLQKILVMCRTYLEMLAFLKKHGRGE